MAVKIQKPQEINKPKQKEFSFWAELKEIVKKAFTPEEKEVAAISSEVKVQSSDIKPSDIKPSTSGREKESKSLESFIQNTDDKTYNQVIGFGRKLLGAIEGKTSQKHPTKNSQQQSK